MREISLFYADAAPTKKLLENLRRALEFLRLTASSRVRQRCFKLLYGFIPGKTLDIFMPLPGYLESQLAIAHETHYVGRKCVGILWWTEKTRFARESQTLDVRQCPSPQRPRHTSSPPRRKSHPRSNLEQQTPLPGCKVREAWPVGGIYGSRSNLAALSAHPGRRTSMPADLESIAWPASARQSIL